jgi:GAF domain-containing protein
MLSEPPLPEWSAAEAVGPFVLVGAGPAVARAVSSRSQSEINNSGRGRIGSLKAAAARLNREQAKEALIKLEGTLGSSTGRQAREMMAKFLNSSIPTYSWVGIYAVDGKDLVLDAWAGPAATEHTRIPIGKGVCGFAAKAGRTEIVSDVSKDPRYLECFLSTRSEIVVPISNQAGVVGEIDIDSDQLDAFSSVDREFLEVVARKAGAAWS